MVLKKDPDGLNMEEGMKLLDENLDSPSKPLIWHIEILKSILDNRMLPLLISMKKFVCTVQQLSEHEIKLPDAILVHKILKSANLGEGNEKRIMATVRDITFNERMI